MVADPDLLVVNGVSQDRHLRSGPDLAQSVIGGGGGSICGASPES